MNQAQVYTGKMQDMGIAFSRQKLAQHIMDLQASKDWETEHQRATTISRAKGIYDAIGLDGRLYPQWEYNGAANGRWLCRKPSMQNTTPGVRACAKVKCVDVAQMELYVAAVMADEGWVIAMYESGVDIHTAVAMALNIDRKAAKVFNLANLYGQTPVGIAARLGISQPEAERILAKWWSLHRRIHQHKNDVWHTARTTTKVTTLDGFSRTIDLCDYNKAANQAYSTVISGSAADLMKRAFVQCWRQGVRINAVIHDEFWFEGGKGEADTVVESIQNAHPRFKLRVLHKTY